MSDIREEQLKLELYLKKMLMQVLYNFREDMNEELYYSLVEIMSFLKCDNLLTIFNNNYKELFPQTKNIEKVKISQTRIEGILSPWHPNKDGLKKHELVKDILEKLKIKKVGCYKYVDNQSHEYRLIFNSRKNYLYVKQHDRYLELIMTYRIQKKDL